MLETRASRAFPADSTKREYGRDQLGIWSATPVIFGGTMFAVPTRIGGTLQKPDVHPVRFSAAGWRLLDIPGNTRTPPGNVISDLKGTTPPPSVTSDQR